MSIKDGKVFFYISKHRNRLVVAGLVCVQLVLSVILSISLAGHLIWPENSSAAAGAPMQIAYEGRLTDSGGNPLGGTGTVYCYRFSIYDAATSGNKLWPASTPTQTTATTTDGVFNAIIGQADTLSSTIFDFSTTSTAFLQVEVNTTTSTCGGSWEALLPRQSVLSSGYALQSANVYGALLKTDTVNNRVQIGTGAGTPSPVYLGLDFRNAADYVGQSCSTNGLMWYNSATSQALICEAGTIQKIGSTGTTTISAINANSGTPASAGTINFDNANGVTFGINGNTVTASVNAGGGGGNMTRYIPVYQGSSASQTLGAMGVTSGSAMFYPINISTNIAFNVVNLVENVSYATSSISGQQTISSRFGIYSNNAGTLSLISSNSYSFAVTNSSVSATLSYPSATGTAGYTYTTVSASTTAQIHSLFGTVGSRIFGLQFGNSMSLSQGMYWLGIHERRSSSSANVGLSAGLVGNVVNFNVAGRLGSGSTAYTGNYSHHQPFFGFGPYTSTASAGYGGTNIPTSAFLSGFAHTATILPMMTFASTT
ncbi:MAG: hypothetical protein AAB365_01740 [Patescibacteria group bacterium]